MEEKIKEKKQDGLKKLEAMKLLNDGYLPKNVSKMTGLPIEKVQELKSRINNTKSGRIAQMIQLSKKENKDTQNQVIDTDKILEQLQQVQQLQEDNIQPKTLSSIITTVKAGIQAGANIDMKVVKLLEKVIKGQDCARSIKEIYYQELCKIYVSINQYGNAAAVARENLKEPLQSKYIESVQQEERKYKIIKLTKQNMAPSEIADNLGIPTVEVIRIKREYENRQKEVQKSNGENR